MLFRNTLATSAGNISGYVLSFILAPVMLAQLGLEQFGVWAVTGALAGYAALLDLGIARALERFVAFHHARGDRATIEQLIGLGVIAVTGVAAVASLAAVAIAPFLAGALDDILTPGEMRIVLLSSVAILVLNTYRGVLSAVPEGMLRMVPPNVAFVFYNVVSFAFSITALLLWPTLVPYALANVAAAAVGLVAGILAVRHVWTPIRVRWPAWPLVKEVLGFGIKSQVTWLADIVNFQVDKVLIALLIDVRAAGAYELANRAVAAVRTIGMMSFAAMLATSTVEIARSGRVAVPEFYRRYMMRALALAMPVLVLAAASAPAVLVAWLGELPEEVVPVFVALTLANAINLTTGVANALLLGEGRAGVLATVATVSAVANILLTVALAPVLGLWGVIAATVVSLVGGSLSLIVYFHRSHQLPALDYLRPSLMPTVLAAAACVPGLAIMTLAGVEDGDRLPAALVSVAFVASFAAIYWPVATRLHYLPERLRLPALRRRRPAASSA